MYVGVSSAGIKENNHFNIALSFSLNRIFFSANEKGTVKQNYQSYFKAFLN